MRAIVEAKHYDFGADVGVASGSTVRQVATTKPTSVPIHPNDDPLSTHALYLQVHISG